MSGFPYIRSHRQLPMFFFSFTALNLECPLCFLSLGTAATLWVDFRNTCGFDNNTYKYTPIGGKSMQQMHVVIMARLSALRQLSHLPSFTFTFSSVIVLWTYEENGWAISLFRQERSFSSYANLGGLLLHFGESRSMKDPSQSILQWFFRNENAHQMSFAFLTITSRDSIKLAFSWRRMM